MIPIKGFEDYLIGEAGEVFSVRKGRLLKPCLNENGYLYISFWKHNRQQSRTVHRLVAEAYIPNPDNKPIVNHLDANRSNPHKDNLEWRTQSENVKHAYNLGNMSAKRNFSTAELQWLFLEVLKGTSMTALAIRMAVGLSRLTVNLRAYAIKTNQVIEFELVLKEMKRMRNAEANVNKQTPIAQLDLSGTVIATFPSLTAAARALGKTSGSISNALNPAFKQSTAYGYQWKFI